MNHTELIMRRRNVREFIAADPMVLVVKRKTDPIPSGAGGFLPGLILPLPPQKARIVLNKRRYNPGIVNSEAGDIPHTDYLLLGAHNLDLKKDDTFEWLDEHYVVIGVHQTRRKESVLASIDFLGGDNRAEQR